MRVLPSPYALAETTERNFPVSRHRSKRVHKKLVKRFQGEFRKEPAMFRLPDGTIIAHPDRYQELKRLIREQDLTRERTNAFRGYDPTARFCP